jgi:hypothetical protein
MATDKAVQNQKVFISLTSVLDLQERYFRVVSMAQLDKQAERPVSMCLERKRAMEEVIDLLGLPINKKTI